MQTTFQDASRLTTTGLGLATPTVLGLAAALAAQSCTLTPLATFTKDGASPSAGLTLGADGTLYEATYAGDAYGDGTMFSLTPLAAVPEASSMVSFGLFLMSGLGGVVLRARRRGAAN